MGFIFKTKELVVQSGASNDPDQDITRYRLQSPRPLVRILAELAGKPVHSRGSIKTVEGVTGRVTVEEFPPDKFGSLVMKMSVVSDMIRMGKQPGAEIVKCDLASF